jgi:hypothetical protein
MRRRPEILQDSSPATTPPVREKRSSVVQLESRHGNGVQASLEIRPANGMT